MLRLRGSDAADRVVVAIVPGEGRSPLGLLFDDSDASRSGRIGDVSAQPIGGPRAVCRQRSPLLGPDR